VQRQRKWGRETTWNHCASSLATAILQGSSSTAFSIWHPTLDCYFSRSLALVSGLHKIVFFQILITTSALHFLIVISGSSFFVVVNKSKKQIAYFLFLVPDCRHHGHVSVSLDALLMQVR
jgi:hypothetical protein